MTSRGISAFTVNAAMTALRFFYRVTLRRHDIADHIPLVPQPQKLPVILSPTEILRSIRGLPVVDPSETLAAYFRCDALRAVMNATKTRSAHVQRIAARVKFMLSAALGDLAIRS